MTVLPRTPRLMFVASALVLALALGIAVIATRTDPLVGAWTLLGRQDRFTFQPGGTWSLLETNPLLTASPGYRALAGTWERQSGEPWEVVQLDTFREMVAVEANDAASQLFTVDLPGGLTTFVCPGDLPMEMIQRGIEVGALAHTSNTNRLILYNLREEVEGWEERVLIFENKIHLCSGSWSGMVFIRSQSNWMSERWMEIQSWIKGIWKN